MVCEQLQKDTLPTLADSGNFLTARLYMTRLWSIENRRLEWNFLDTCYRFRQQGKIEQLDPVWVSHGTYEAFLDNICRFGLLQGGNKLNPAKVQPQLVPPVRGDRI